METLWIEVFVKKSKSFLIATLYRPPEGSNYLLPNFNTLFNDLLINVEETSLETILLGDVNVNYLNRNENKEFKSLLPLRGFKQLVNDPTRITKESSTLIDIIASTNPHFIKDVKVFPASLSDHDAVGCIRKPNHLKFELKVIKVRDYAKYNPDDLNSELSNVDWSPVYKSKDANVAANRFNQIVNDVFLKHAPFITKRVKGKPCPWLDKKYKVDANKRDKALRKFRKSKTDENWQHYKNTRNRANNSLNSSKSKYYKQLLSENRTNPKSFWNIIKSIFPTKEKSSSNTSNDNGENRANLFSSYFASAVSFLKEKSIFLSNFKWRLPRNILSRTMKKFRFRYVSNIFIEKHLKSLKRKKSTGLDNLPSNLLKDCASSKNPLTYIINLSLDTCTVPRIWKKAMIIPTFKSGSVSNPENYRPISVLPILSKVLEKVVHTQLMDYLESNKLISNFQFGYRSNRSTELATTLFLDNIRRGVNNGKLCWCCIHGS